MEIAEMIIEMILKAISLVAGVVELVRLFVNRKNDKGE